MKNRNVGLVEWARLMCKARAIRVVASVSGHLSDRLAPRAAHAETAGFLPLALGLAELRMGLIRCCVELDRIASALYGSFELAPTLPWPLQKHQAAFDLACKQAVETARAKIAGGELLFVADDYMTPEDQS